MGTEQQHFTGDASQLVQEYDKLEERARKLEETQRRGSKASTEANKKLQAELKELAREAEQTTKSVATPLEKYEQQMARLDKQLQAGAISQETYNRAVAKAGQELEAASRTQDSYFKSGLTNLVQMAAGWVSVTSAINLASNALKEKQRIEREAADKQVSVAASEALVLQNLTGVSSAGKQQFLGQVAAIQARTGFGNLSQLNQAAAAGISASAGNQQATLSSIEAAARVSRLTPDQLETFTGGALDIAKASGSQDARANLGFLLSAGAMSRVTAPELQARNIAPAVGSIVGTVGGDRQQATIEGGALFAALSNIGVDERGDATKTSSIAFAVQLRDFFEQGVTEGTGKKKKTFKPAADPNTLAGRIAFLQNNPELREKFLANASFEQQFKIPIEQLLRGGDAATEFNKARGAINFDIGAYEQLAGEVGGLTANQRRGAAAAGAEANITRAQVADTLAGRTSQAEKILTETLAQTSREGVLGQAGFINRQAYGGLFRGTLSRNPAAPEAAAEAVLAAEEQRIRRGIGTGGLGVANLGLIGGGGALRNEARTDEQLTAEERERIALLREQRDLLRSIANQEGNAGQAAAVNEMGRHLEN